MAMQVAMLSFEDRDRIRKAEAQRMVAETGGCGLTFEDATECIIAYYELLREFHEVYDLDPEEIYEFDVARGIVFKALD